MSKRDPSSEPAVARCGRVASWEPVIINEGGMLKITLPVLRSGQFFVPLGWLHHYVEIAVVMQSHPDVFKYDDQLGGYVQVNNFKFPNSWDAGSDYNYTGGVMR